MSTTVHLKWIGCTLCGVAAWMAAATTGFAQGGGMVLPMLIATPEAIQDEFGQNLRGDATDPTGDLVQILKLTGNTVTPPDIDGSPGPGTEIIPNGICRIGNLVAAGLKNAGMFAVAIPSNQPPPTTKLFVRVFNKDTATDASFYGDSSVFAVAQSENVYLVNVSLAGTPLDPGDSDEDGLNNSYEKSYGSSSSNADSDGDGMSDLMEHLAGTDLLDSARRLRIEDQAPASETDVAVTWQTVSGRCYQLEYTEDNLSMEPVFIPIGDPVQAHSDFTTLEDVNGLLSGPRMYRVWALDKDIVCEDE